MTTFAFNKVIIRHGNNTYDFSFRNIMTNLTITITKFNPLIVNSLHFSVFKLLFCVLNWSNLNTHPFRVTDFHSEQ